MDRNVRHAQQQTKRIQRKEAEDYRCLLCEGSIEVSEYGLFFMTGYCRHCHDTLYDEK